eukprot:364594-Chlamydomonas_euryale.AAC.1
MEGGQLAGLSSRCHPETIKHRVPAEREAIDQLRCLPESSWHHHLRSFLLGVERVAWRSSKAHAGGQGQGSCHKALRPLLVCLKLHGYTCIRGPRRNYLV